MSEPTTIPDPFVWPCLTHQDAPGAITFLQEAFGFGNEAPDLAAKVDPVSAKMYAPNIWPQRPDDFRDVMVSYYDEMQGLARRVLGAMAMALLNSISWKAS